MVCQFITSIFPFVKKGVCSCFQSCWGKHRKAEESEGNFAVVTTTGTLNNTMICCSRVQIAEMAEASFREGENHKIKSASPVEIEILKTSTEESFHSTIDQLSPLLSPIEKVVVPCPLEKGVLSDGIADLYFSFPNPSFFLLLTLSLVLLLVHFVTKKGGGNSVPNAWQSLVELIYDFVPNLVNEQIGGLSGNVKQKFFPCISVTFTFSLFRNLSLFWHINEGIEEIMADHVHQEMTRNWILVYLRL